MGLRSLSELVDHRLSGLTIIMLASDRWADNIAKTYDLGLGGYLVKPIRRSDLQQTIRIALERSQSGFLATFHHSPPLSLPSCRPLRILLSRERLAGQPGPD